MSFNIILKNNVPEMLDVTLTTETIPSSPTGLNIVFKLQNPDNFDVNLLYLGQTTLRPKLIVISNYFFIK